MHDDCGNWDRQRPGRSSRFRRLGGRYRGFHCLMLVCLVWSGCGDAKDSKFEGGRAGVDVGPATNTERGGADGAAHKSAIRFTDVTAESGVNFTYRNGEEAGHFAIVESLGGGVGLFDYDADGDLDLFAPGGGEFGPGPEIRGRPGALYRNDRKGRFTEITEPADVAFAPHYSHGVCAADFDNDGFPDLLVTGYAGLLLFQNQGDGTFREIAEPAGLTDRLWSSSAATGDFDGDGALDLYVAHYVNWSFDNHPHCAGPKPNPREVCPPRQFEPLPDTVYLSNGDGTFRDASSEVGLSNEGKGLGVVTADVDVDGDLDVYVGNDTVPNFLYLNDGTGRLAESGITSGTALSDRGLSDGSMGVDLGDFNLDGRPDLWAANYESESFALYRNEGRAFFQHVSQATGVTAVGELYVGWGTVFVDFDSDGDEDVFASNGHVVRYPVNAPLRQKPLLFENLAGKRFVNAAEQSGPYLDSSHMGRGVAAGDLDNDGDLDLAVSHINEPVALLSNETSNNHHWVSLRLIGVASNRSAVGSVVQVSTAAGTQMRQVKGGASYASTNDTRLHFGLGDAEKIDKLTIRWPNGTTQELAGPAVDRLHTFVEPAEE